MVRSKNEVITGRLQLYKKVMGYASLVIMTYHMWLSFARHFFGAENRFDEKIMKMLHADAWAVLLLLIAALVYCYLVKSKSPVLWRELKAFVKRLRSPEILILSGLFLYYVVCNFINRKVYAYIFDSTDKYLMDAFILIFIFFPFAQAVGQQKMRKYMDWMLHAITIFSTGFILWALWNLFRLNIVTLPNGLQLGMTSKYTFYPGVNGNIGAMIGTTVILISLYMIACHRRWIRWIYLFVLLPHLCAVLLTDSRACYLALLIAIPFTLFMGLFNKYREKEKLAARILVPCIMAGLSFAVLWWLRKGIFDIFDRITNLNAKLNRTPSEEQSLLEDTGRLKIWVTSLRMMISSPRAFFFGSPQPLIPNMIEQTMTEIYGKGSIFAHAHNMILQTGLVTGVPGMIALLVFFVRLAVRCVKVGLKKEDAARKGYYVFPIALLAMVFVNMFEPFLLFYISVMGCLFFLFSGCTVAAEQTVNE